ncbi:hypothetical protein EZS27_024346 [termite gut metagenome]|uniref:Uncharacterized protein n=1 Tax=termite gut metagenome TaxID=433724 RepID=A0A5J4R0L4_9ZZZZ
MKNKTVAYRNYEPFIPEVLTALRRENKARSVSNEVRIVADSPTRRARPNKRESGKWGNVLQMNKKEIIRMQGIEVIFTFAPKKRLYIINRHDEIQCTDV